MMMGIRNILSSRWYYAVAFFICHELIVAAYYFQYVQGLMPCPLCMMQRVVVVALGLIYAVMLLVHPQRWMRGFLHSMVIIVAILGLMIAGRHVYLLHLPADQVPACGPGLAYLFENFPWAEALKTMLMGSGECAKNSWQWLGLSMPGWMALIFSAFVINSIVALSVLRSRRISS